LQWRITARSVDRTCKLKSKTVSRLDDLDGDIYDIMLGDDAPHSWIAMMNDAEQAFVSVAVADASPAPA
jgi:hypothetical protein